MILHQNQKLVANDTHRFRVVNCGRRFGKTSLAAIEMIGYAIAYDNARVPYYAPTRDDARDIMWLMLCDEAQDIIIDKNESRLELIVRNQYGGTSLMALYGWEAVQDRKKGVGVKNNFIVLDEVAKYRNFREGWEEVLRPTLTDLRGHALFTSTPNGFNHFYDLYRQEDKDSDYKSFHFTSYDNPYMPTDEIDKAKLELTEDRFAQEYLADFRKTEGLVYKEFSRDLHLYDTLDINIKETIAGADFGFTNPTAVIEIKVDNDNNYWVDDEYYKTGQTDIQIAEYIATKKYNKVYPDPESPSAIKELVNNKVNVREVLKNKDSIKNGITKIRELFKQNRLKINIRCTNLIYELETYSYPKKQNDRNEYENPIKENDHALDALRYAIYMQNDYKQSKAVQYIPTNLDRNPNYKVTEQKFAKQFIPNR